MKVRTSIVSATVLVLAVCSVVGYSSLRHGPSATATVDAPTLASRAELTRLIGEFERRAADEPTPTNLKFLAQMYLQRGRFSGDIGSYAAAQEALEKADAIAPDDPETHTMLAGLAATSHDFVRAVTLARQLIAQNPHDLGPVTILGDSLLELGHYDEAAEAYGRLTRDSPTAAAAIVRQARLTFLHGDAPTARLLAARAKEQAVASAFSDAGLAYYTMFQAQLEHDRGDYQAAAALSRQALKESPGYYIALVGLAKNTAAVGHLDEAIALYEQAVAVVPQPETLSALGDLYALKGNAAAAESAYDTVGVIGALALANRQVYNRAVALHDADHGVNTVEAVRLSEAELESRQDIYGYDVYAWCLYSAGRFDDAAVAAERALALGTPDARLHYHAGMIAKARNDNRAASVHLQRAIALSPNFDPLNTSRAIAALTEVQTMIKAGRP